MIHKHLQNFELAGETSRTCKKEYVRTKDQGYCVLCDKPVKLVSFQDAANRLDKTVEVIFNLANSFQIHRFHNRGAIVMICLDSLIKEFNNQKTRYLNPNYILFLAENS